MVNHGYNVLIIRSANALAERETARNRFNDRKDHSQSLVTSLQVTAASVKFSTCKPSCWIAVFVDVPAFHATMQQAICRINAMRSS